MDWIVTAVSEETKIAKQDIMANDHSPGPSEARHLVCWLARRVTGYTLKDIARYLNRHHSTVINSIATIKTRAKIDSNLSSIMQLLTTRYADEMASKRQVATTSGVESMASILTEARAHHSRTGQLLSDLGQELEKYHE